MKEYHIGDVIEYKGLNDDLSGYVNKTGFIFRRMVHILLTDCKRLPDIHL